jgi:hypothetical protein
VKKIKEISLQMKKSDKSDKIQGIIDKWLVNYLGIGLREEKLKKRF